MRRGTSAWDELARLRAVERLGPMDAPAGAFAESVVTAAASVAGTPIGALTIVHRDRVQVRASCGIAVGAAPRGDAICSHAILATIPLIVPDARCDVRLAANPFVVGPPHIRFYAGFPLVFQEQFIGVLCVADDRPRELSSEQCARLSILAEGAAAWLRFEARQNREETLT